MNVLLNIIDISLKKLSTFRFSLLSFRFFLLSFYFPLLSLVFPLSTLIKKRRKGNANIYITPHSPTKNFSTPFSTRFIHLLESPLYLLSVTYTTFQQNGARWGKNHAFSLRRAPSNHSFPRFFLHLSEKSRTFAAEKQPINISDSLVIH
ncbi:MAG: hypothetical protein IJ621_04100 [Paludibacteraceae bacterium]|nr:hypothetical protein [Paludibacteraceae bacterium]